VRVTRLFDNPEWMRFGACTKPDVDPDTMFPPRGGDHTAQAKLICRGCKVRQLCLDWALTNHIPHGVAGGLSPRERWAVQRQEDAA